MYKQITTATVLALAMICWLSLPAQGNMTYSFTNITNNNLTDAAISQAQLYVDVIGATDSTSLGEDVIFRFRNIGPDLCSIADVYFDDGALLALSTLDWGTQTGVSFSEFATPRDLPGGSDISPAFQTTKGFCADSDPPVQPMGVNPYEWLDVYFELKTDMNYDDVINSLADDSLRIGIHVQGFASGGSESFINGEPTTAPAIVPAPDALIVGAIGIVLVGYLRRLRTL